MQLNNVLREFSICIVAAYNFPVDDYVRIFKGQKIFIEYFKAEMLKTVSSYNCLCLSKKFYERFLGYKYMLIYQSDAYVFRNQLQFWTEQGYDYIGAPFYKNNREPFDMHHWMVGNGGFSLRATKKCYALTKKIEFYHLLIKVFDTIRFKKLVFNFLIKLGFNNLAIIQKIILNKYNEDYVFGVLSKSLMKNFIVPPIEKAWQFSFEAHPSKLYTLNNNQLPFGCHGWEKYEPEFWVKFIYEPTEGKLDLLTEKNDGNLLNE